MAVSLANQKQKYKKINERLKNRKQIGFYHTIFKIVELECTDDFDKLKTKPSTIWIFTVPNWSNVTEIKH